MVLKEIINCIKDAESIAIMPHVSVDGDGLGSSLALASALDGMGKKAVVILEEQVPNTYSFLPGADRCIVFSEKIESFDLFIALDTGDVQRLGRRAELFLSAEKTVNIDHHQTNTEFAVYNYVDGSSAAVGEIIYRLIGMMGCGIDAAVATCLYVAIAADTGGFRYSNTTALTHQIAGDLLNSGVDAADVSQRIFETVSLARVKLMSAAIGTIELFDNGRISCVTVTDEMLKNCGATEEDNEGIVNIARNIKGVEAAFLLRSKDSGEVKINLRSNGHADVSKIAAKHGGGGHKKAAGFTVSGDAEDLKKMLIKELKESL
ncbi:MAG: bifunctional oligoribonuclease/PAP phosphatase NrnA [Clostridia bacterium]|nr:bifunctional oligoribonuclease/PAP phosphatase NrnA [Clostridia bacterium]